MTNYEYGIMMRGYDDELHRGPMSKEAAESWMQSARDDFPNAELVDEMWWIVRRPVGEWEKVNV